MHETWCPQKGAEYILKMYLFEQVYVTFKFLHINTIFYKKRHFADEYSHM